MKVVVTGGAGYVGSVTSLLLVERGDDVTVYDNLSTGHREAVPTGATFILGDLSDKDKLHDLFRRGHYDAVLHFAASIVAPESVKDPLGYFDNNLCATINLLRAMMEHGTRRLVFSSSAAVYGNPEVLPVTEETPCRPTNPYGETKLMAEKVLEWCQSLKGLRYVSLRYFNAAGSWKGRGDSPETHLIPIVVEAARGRRESVTIYGTDYPTADGTCIRDYVHVADLAEAHLLALDRMDTLSGVYNLGSSRGSSVREVINTVKQVTRKDFKVKEGKRRRGDSVALVASSEKASRELGWRPSRSSLPDIVESTWRHLSESNLQANRGEQSGWQSLQ